MSKTKIEWTDYTWNPVWGCKADCDYCYAKGIAKRFAYQIAKNELDAMNINNVEQRENRGEDIADNIANFTPTFLESTYQNFKFPKNASKIFIGSMSDIAFWQDDWIKKVADKIKKYPFHTFLLLTKFPEIYQKIYRIMPYNVWFGVTVTKKSELVKLIDLNQFIEPKRKRYVSFEPVLEYIPTGKLFGAGLIDWVIVGAMSGKNKQRTKTEWVGSIVSDAKKYYKPIFVKQLEINGKIEKDISKFPKKMQLREFPV